MIVVGCAQCRRQSATGDTRILGNYELVGHDKAGRLIFTGNISFTAFDQMDLKGQCKVVQTASEFEGAVDKDGPCEGTLVDNKITLDLAPQLADGGLIFQGQVHDDRITGIWMIETFAGTEPQGKFEAVKKT